MKDIDRNPEERAKSGGLHVGIPEVKKPAPRKKRSKAHTVWLDHDGKLDGLFVDGVSILLERMNNTGWWMGIYLPDGRSLALNFGAVNQRAKEFVHLSEEWKGGKEYEGDSL